MIVVWSCICVALLLVALGYAIKVGDEKGLLVVVVSYVLFVLALTAGFLLAML